MELRVPSRVAKRYPIRFKDGYFAPPPQDTLLELRNECVRILEEYFGIPCDAHHHEVATAPRGRDGGIAR